MYYGTILFKKYYHYTSYETTYIIIIKRELNRELIMGK